MSDVDFTSLWAYGLISNRTGEAIVEEGDEFNIDSSIVSYGFNLVVDSSGNQLDANASPLDGGEQLISTSALVTDHNLAELARIYSIMAPIRDAIFFHYDETSAEEWDYLTSVLTLNGIKTSTDGTVLSSSDVYDYVATGPTDGNPVLQYLEEAELDLKILGYRDFDFTNPDGVDSSLETGLTAERGIATTGDDVLLGGSSAETIKGSGGYDSISGGAGADVLYGNLETDTLRGGDDADTIFGGQNDGPVSDNGGVTAQRQGTEYIYGENGNDVLYGNHGGDRLEGGAGADTLFGGQDNDTLYGGSENDLLFGNRNDDALFGGAGDDTLSGGVGNDTLSGGDGNDAFYFASGSGEDAVLDDLATGDLIFIAHDINGTGIATADDVLARLSDDANGEAVLDLGNGNAVTFAGISSSSLTASQFDIF